MRILYICQYFATAKAATGTRPYEFARRWAAAGHEVTAVTSKAHITAEDFGGKEPGRIYTRLHVDGFNMIVFNVSYHQTMGYVRRVLSFILFVLLATAYVLVARRPHVVYASSTPPTVAIPAMFGRWVRGIPYVFEILDAWPAVPVGMGIIKNPLLVWIAEMLEKLAYRGADYIVAASPGMESVVRRVAPHKPVVMIPNTSAVDFFRTDADGAAFRSERGWGAKCICAHTGTMGRINGADVVVRAALHFRQRADVHFALIGAGNEKSKLREMKSRMGLTNFEVSDSVPKNMMPQVLAAVDVCLMTVAPFPVLEHNSANKFFDYLAAGKPVVLNYSGWQREALESADAGYGSRMGDDAEFFDRIQELIDDPAKRTMMGKNARRLAEQRFNRDVHADHALAITISVAEKHAIRGKE